MNIFLFSKCIQCTMVHKILYRRGTLLKDLNRQLQFNSSDIKCFLRNRCIVFRLNFNWCFYMFGSLVWKSKHIPPACREINASPFFSFFPPILVGVLFNFIMSKNSYNSTISSLCFIASKDFSMNKIVLKS